MWRGSQLTCCSTRSEDLSFDQMAATMSEVFGREIMASEMAMDQFGQMMRDFGASDRMA